MQEAEFVNDLRCNYLTIPYLGTESDFVLRMLMENASDVFLPMELRRLDGQMYLYYNISGMQSMEIIYAERTIDREAFRTFIWHLHEAAGQSRELFLPGEGVCLEPSAIFWNLDMQRWEFIYIPKRDGGERIEIQSERERLAEFLVMHIDYEDKELTDTAYRFYEEICAGRMRMDFFPEERKTEGWSGQKEERKAEGWSGQREERKAEGWSSQKEEKQQERETGGFENAEGNGFIEGISAEEQEETAEAENKSGNKGLWKFLTVLWCTAAGAVFLLGRTMQNIILPGGTAIAALTALTIFTGIQRRRRRREPALSQADAVYMEQENTYFPYEEEEKSEGYTREEEKTVYMDIEPVQERKLYGVGKFRQHKIFLEGLPCIVGKDKTMVNHIISDTSVSRMHARFFSEGDTLWMQDLNSTNGTYHNGLRLRPNEKVMLEPEDEVGFGRVQFVFR